MIANFRKRRSLFFTVLNFLIPGLMLVFQVTSGQEIKDLPSLRLKIAMDFSKLRQFKADSLKFPVNDRLIREMGELLNKYKKNDLHIDTIKGLVQIASEDQRFTFYHWNLQRQNGVHNYYGFLKIKSGDSARIIRLTDRSDSIQGADTMPLDAGNWYGALYYKVIPCQTFTGQQYYTLLGWSGETDRVTSKVIEILQFGPSGEPRFGMRVFRNYSDDAKARIIFRFSAGTTMALRFEKQVISSSKKWNKKRREFDVTPNEEWMIVADRLSPLDPLMEGQAEYYVPAGDISDGFLLEKGVWNFKTDIETRNKGR